MKMLWLACFAVGLSAQPPQGEPRGGRERCAVHPRDDAQQPILLLVVDVRAHLTQPAALPVAGQPSLDGFARVVSVATYAMC